MSSFIFSTSKLGNSTIWSGSGETRQNECWSADLLPGSNRKMPRGGSEHRFGLRRGDGHRGPRECTASALSSRGFVFWTRGRGASRDLAPRVEGRGGPRRGPRPAPGPGGAARRSVTVRRSACAGRSSTGGNENVAQGGQDREVPAAPAGQTKRTAQRGPWLEREEPGEYRRGDPGHRGPGQQRLHEGIPPVHRRYRAPSVEAGGRGALQDPPGEIRPVRRRAAR